MAQGKKYVFTLNNPTVGDKVKLQTLVALNDKVKYIVYGEEVGESGTPHYQGAIHFKTNHRLSAVKATLPFGCHIEIQKARDDLAIDYCKKDGKVFQAGVAPMSKKRQGEMEKERWEVARKKAKLGDFDGIDADILIRCYGALKSIHKDNMPKVNDALDVTGTWLWGEAGAGKSRLARQRHPDFYNKLINKWWDGYKGEDAVIIDDWDPNHDVLGHHLKIWSDRYAFLAEVKGGAMNIRPNHIVVTSQYPPEECFKDQRTVAAIRRRFKVEHVVRL